jgi:hypothetical protein
MRRSEVQRENANSPMSFNPSQSSIFTILLQLPKAPEPKSTNHPRLFLDIPGQYKSTYEERDVAIDTATITTHHTHQSLSRSKPWPPFPTVDADSYYLRPHKPYSPTDFLDARWNNMLLGNVTITTHSMIFAQLWTSEI